MESIQALIAILQQQEQQHADPAVLLSTLSRIQEVVMSRPGVAPQSAGSSKVAVMMPGHSRFMPPEPSFSGREMPEQHAISEIIRQIPSPETAPAEVPKMENNGWLFDPMKETPTLAQQVNGRELNDIIGQSGTSLNDLLKTNKTELSEVLTDVPIRDLKKGIGINDRYVFVNELFRGDEAMYERSIKTINGFRIMAEAEYWMERELKVKLGWDDGKPTTQHFYQLVKRRFS